MRRDGTWQEDLLLFRAVTTTDARAAAVRSLRAGMGEWLARHCDEVEMWELCDPTGDDGDEPAAVACARRLGDGSLVELLGVAVSPARRRRGIAGRLVDEVTQSFRASGASRMVAAVPADAPGAMRVLRRAGFRPSASRPRHRVNGVDLVWFDVEL